MVRAAKIRAGPEGGNKDPVKGKACAYRALPTKFSKLNNTRAAIVSASSIDDIYRGHSRQVLATLIRLLGDFTLAEEAMHDAFAVALDKWPREGIPANPSAWLVSTARFKAIDQLRRRSRHEAGGEEYEAALNELVDEAEEPEEQLIEDDQLRLIFICCHPSLPAEAQLALTLREVCGITTEEIAAAFLTRTPTIAQRIVRAKQKIRDDRLPYEIPAREQLPERLQAVLAAIYLLFNEGYSASSGERIVRHDLAGEAIRLCRLLFSLLPHPEAAGLLALMLLQDARKAARTDGAGELVTLEDQDRGLWDRQLIDEGRELVTRALLTRRFGPYTIQAAIAAVHGDAVSFAETDWEQIVGLYDVLLQMQPTAVVRLNRAVAVAMVEGPRAGLDLVEELAGDKALQDYYLLHATIADFQRRLGNPDAARQAYEKALALTQQGPERRFLEQRIASL